ARCAAFRAGARRQGAGHRPRPQGRRARAAGHRLRARRAASGPCDAALRRRRCRPARGGVHRGRAQGPGPRVERDVDAAPSRRGPSAPVAATGQLTALRKRQAEPMPLRLATSDPGFESAFRAFLAAKREASEDVDAAVRAIIARVRAEGDAALIELTRRFDRLDLAEIGVRIGEAEVAAAAAGCGRETVAALELAAARIEAHHRRQLPTDDRYTDALGAELGSRWTAIESVGLYVPGGLASYPSSVLMNAIPARVAGVPRIAMAVPSPGGELNPLVLAAAHLAGVSEIYRIGGAQAVAALAYGTASVAPVAKIVGPGNAYVAAAKRQVFGTVGIDSVAGPSEVLVVADGNNDPEWLAA